MDIEDLMVKAIQSYDGGNELIMAIADQLAPHIIQELGLKQDWAILTLHDFATYVRVDDVDHECDSRAAIEGVLRYEQYKDSKKPFQSYAPQRRAVGTRLFTEWTEDTNPLVVDEELAALVAEDAV